MKKHSTDLIDLTPQVRKILDASEYVVFIGKQHDNIKSSRFVPPKIGSDNFGFFEVELNLPIYEFADQ